MISRHEITGFLLMIMFLLITPITGRAAGLDGHIDSVNGNTISGWALNTDLNGQTEVQLKITQPANGEVVHEVSVPAGAYREDLVPLGYGSGNCGFRAVVDWTLLRDGIYQIEGYVNGEKLPNMVRYNTLTKETQSIALYNPSIRSLGIFQTTAYCPCSRCCGKGGGRRTSSGTVPTASRTIAVDTRVIPMGTKIMINGVIYTAEDTGSGVGGKHIDIFFNSHQECRQYGVRKVEAFLVQ